MNAQLNLKELEKKAFKSFYQDGVWDLFFGLLMLVMYLQDVLLQGVESKPVKYGTLILMEIIVIGFLFLAKRYLTVPRLGQASFGGERKKNATKIFIINLVSLVLLAALFFISKAMKNSPEGQEFLMSADQWMAIGLGFWITLITSIMAYFMDFNRMYFYALIYGITFTAALLINSELTFLIASALMLVPGIYIFTTFLLNNKPIREE